VKASGTFLMGPDITPASGRRRFVAYCALTFAISWGGILLLVGPGSVPLDEEHLALLLGLGYVGMLLGPSLAAIVLTIRFDGRAGLRTLRDESTRWRVGGRAWAFALLTAPLSILAVLLALSVAAPEFIPRLLVDADRITLVQYVAVSALLTGVLEELGWTGFAVRGLLPRYGVLRTGLGVGLVCAIWNTPIVIVKELSVPTPGTLAMAAFLAVCLFTWQVAYRVLMVATYDRTRSVLVAMLMQTVLVAAWTGLTPTTLDQTTVMVFYLSLTIIWIAIAIVMFGRHGEALPMVAAGVDRA
jgi:membrane protease YdiL (CAAX protease family)